MNQQEISSAKKLAELKQDILTTLDLVEEIMLERPLKFESTFTTFLFNTLLQEVRGLRISSSFLGYPAIEGDCP